MGLLGAVLIAAIVASAHQLLIAGAPTLRVGVWPGLECLLLPLAGDYGPHLASYGFMAAAAAVASRGLRALRRQHRATRGLLRACLASRTESDPLGGVAGRLGLIGRLDVVSLAAPVAFCHGYLRPRVLVSTGLIALLEPEGLEALLLHEREHLRRRDPLKVALGQLLSASLFFVPLVGALHRRYLVEKELLADRAAIASLGSDAPLAAALARLIDARSTIRPVPAVGADEALAARIDALLGEPVQVDPGLRPAPLAFSAVVALLAFAPVLALPAHADAVPSHHNIVAGCHVRETDQAS